MYVPAETLAQHGQTKLHRTQPKKHHNRHHQHHSEISSTPAPSQDAYAREILQQLQRQHEEKNQFHELQREKEFARLRAEQKEMEKQERLRQEAARKEQELMRQREAQNKRKELEKLEDSAREFQRIQNARTKERQDDRKLSFRAKEEEERRREHDRIAAINHEKELRRQKQYQQNGENGEGSAESQTYETEQPHALPLVQDSQLHHQHLTEVTNENIKTSRPRNNPRSKLHHYQQQQEEEYQEPSEPQPTTPSPNQPPLSVYMGSSLSDHHKIQLSDVLKTLKNARSIAVLDSFGPDTPRVFVGPRNLDPPEGFAKFDLPYLSSIENNRVERKVDKLPFFVAPLSFEPPPGYSKIPFPAPHIGSVVINSLENIEIRPLENQNPNPSPLIEPNAYNQPLPLYDISSSVSYPPESTPRYEVSSSLPPSQLTTKWKFRDFFENKPSTEIPSVVTAASYNEERTPTSKFERLHKNKNYYNPNEVSTTPSYFSPKTVTAFSFEQTVPQSTPSYHEDQIRNHNVHSHFINQNIGHHHQEANRYHVPEPHQQTNQRYPIGPALTNTYYLSSPPNYDEQSQYNLPAELPAISPQLPGLVNALVEKTDLSSTLHPTTSTSTTTTTTTTETPTTTYRPRNRQRYRIFTFTRTRNFK